MKTTETAQTEDSSRDHAKEDTTDTTSRQLPSFLARQYSASEGGVQTDMNCPNCDDEISGSFLPVFRCPHCESQIWRDEDGDVTSYENKNVCQESSRGFASEAAKKALITSIVSGVEAILLYSFKLDQHVQVKSQGFVFRS